MSNAVEVRSVSKAFRIYHEVNKTLKSALLRGRRGRYEEFRALDDVSLDVAQGTSFALVGNNGSGKSTLLKCMAKILEPDSGTIRRDGRVAALLEVGSGFHPELSGRDNIFLNGSILGMSRSEIASKLDEIVEFSGVERFIDQPVKNYSSGMYVRLGFSVAIHVEPEILLVDEVLAVGDAAFQDKCAAKFSQMRREGRTVVMVSHSLAQVRAMAGQAAWLDDGKVAEIGDAAGVLDSYENFSHAVSGTVDIGGLTHTGVGGVRIVGASLRGADGRPDVAVVGQEAVVTLSYVADGRFDAPVVGIALESVDGVTVAATNTRNAGSPLDFLEGEGQIDVRLPEVMLHPGSYLITAGVEDAGSTPVDYVRGVAQFSVENGGRTWSGGYLALPVQWGSPVSSKNLL